MRKMKNVLWITGRLPSPLFTGDALYSTSLLKALAMAGDTAISLVGTRRDDRAIGEHILGLPGVTCVDVPPPRTSGLSSLLTALPKDAYNLGTPELEQALVRLLKRDWDWIVADHTYSSGLLPVILKDRRNASICHVAHNAEGTIRPQIARSFGNPLRRAIMQFDAEKYRRLERKLLGVADAVICITDEDEPYFRQFVKRVHVIPPIYLGEIAPPRAIDQSRPRAVLLLGAFEWVAKQKNLVQAVDALLPSFVKNGITLNVVGTVPQMIKDRYAGYGPNLVFHGRVDDVSPHLLASRGGLVPEVLGGGFKLKVLDYAFERLPIFGLKEALAGITPEEQSAMFLAEDLDGLAKTIVENIDDLDLLNRNQARLFEFFSERFGLERGLGRIREVFLQGELNPASRSVTTTVAE
jgi:glycosyltransferase involved in cell wall biosynthesis